MRRFKYYESKIYNNKGLTPGNVYDLIKYVPQTLKKLDSIYIRNDDGIITRYYIFDYSTNIYAFKEVPTIEYRNYIIDEILN